MHPARRFIDRQLTIAWIVVLSIVASAFSPAVHALAAADAGPGGEICSALGVVTLGQGSNPQPEPSVSPQHCSWCVIHTVAGLPPATLQLPRPAEAVPHLPAVLRLQPRAAVVEAYAGPRGPPRLA